MSLYANRRPSMIRNSSNRIMRSLRNVRLSNNLSGNFNRIQTYNT